MSHDFSNPSIQQGLEDALSKILDELDIACIKKNEVIFLDSGTPITQFTPPRSIKNSPIVWEGLEFLRTSKPPVALLLSLHGEGADFRRLERHSGHILKSSPVCGVEAFADEKRSDQIIPRPQLAQKNHWLKAFQQTQFPWMDQHTILMLPCEPQWEGELGHKLNELYDLFFSLPNCGLEQYPSTVRHALQHPLLVYLSIYRAWGLLGQFGHWLQQPMVQKLLEDYHAHIPLILGSGHTAERYLLQEYCELDTISIISDRPFSAGSPEQQKEFASYYTWQGAEILRQRMHAADIAVLFPNE